VWGRSQIARASFAIKPIDESPQVLRAFWESVTAHPHLDWTAQLIGSLAQGEAGREILNHVSALAALIGGAPGFFNPRFPPPWFRHPPSKTFKDGQYSAFGLAARGLISASSQSRVQRTPGIKKCDREFDL
jgi:hypothetical protein